MFPTWEELESLSAREDLSVLKAELIGSNKSGRGTDMQHSGAYVLESIAVSRVLVAAHPLENSLGMRKVKNITHYVEDPFPVCR